MGMFDLKSSNGSLRDAEQINLELRAKDLSTYTDRELLNNIVRLEKNLARAVQAESDHRFYTNEEYNYEGEDYAIIDLFRKELEVSYSEFDRRQIQ